MSKLIILNNLYFYFKIFLYKNKIFLLNNNFYLFFYFFNIFKLYKYFLIIKKFYFYSINNIFLKFLNYFKKFFIIIFLKIIYINIGFVYYRYFLKVGLGFRKKFLKSKNLFVMYVGLRHWIVVKTKTNFYFNPRRKNIYIFTQYKQNLNYFSSSIKYIRKESVFKTKGIMFRRSIIKRKRPRSLLFARRVKFSKVKLKLSKKQKLV